MSTVISYDKPVKNLIDELDATGHVTHKSYTKTSVTIHHNAGRLSHEGVLNVWKTRPASAHFDVDARGDVAQYVRVYEYAWAVGNTEGNMHSISIEMANSTLSPDWQVADVTWKSAARLAGWLFANIIKQRPSVDNFFQHEHWSATTCAGPYVDKIWTKMLLEAQAAYDKFKQTTTPPPPPNPTTEWLRTDVTAFQRLLKTADDGKWGIRTDVRAQSYRDVANIHVNGESEAEIRLVQFILGVKDDAIVGPITKSALTERTKKIQKVLHVRDDGIWGNNTEDHYQRFRKEWRGRY